MSGRARVRSDKETARILQPSLFVFLSQYKMVKGIRYGNTYEHYGICELKIGGRFVVYEVPNWDGRVASKVHVYDTVIGLVDDGWRVCI